MNDDARPAPNVAAAYPLTPLQEGMLYHSIREPGGGAYLTHYTATLIGPLDSEAFRQAWRLAAERHEPFRTFFTWNARERPLQVVRHRVDLPFAELDWTGLQSDEQRERWSALRADDLKVGLDTSRAPVMRFTLARVGDGETWFLWTVYHGLLDGWSGRMVLAEVYEDYSALRRGQAPARQPGLPFGHYIQWLDSRDRSAAEAFWRTTLSGLRGPTPLPSGTRPASAPSERRWSRTSRHVPASRASALEATARRCRVTLNTIALAAWGLLLARHADQSDVVCGTTLTVRPPELAGAQQAAGLYMNVLPVRLACEPVTPVAEWLADVQGRQSAVRDFDYSSLSDVQRWSPLAPGRSAFESLVAFERFPGHIGGRGTFGDLRVDEESIVEHSNYPLALLVVPDEGIDLVLVFDCSRYDEASADRLLARYARVLDAVAESTAGTVGELTLVPEDEEAVLAGWSHSGDCRDVPDAVALVERVAAQRPESEAVVSGATRLSYGQLNADANRLARRLIELRAGPGSFVAVLLDRSPDFITTMLAALKAGAAYVPLDPHAPANRTIQTLEQLIAHSGAGPLIVVTRSARAPSRPSGCTVLDLDAENLNGLDASAPPAHARPEDAAYVIYTSGSTGTPKGVVVERRQLAWSIAARVAYYPRPVSSFLLLSPTWVDSSTAGIYWSLCAGAVLVLPPGRIEQDPWRLRDLIDREHVSHTLLVPSLYRAFLDTIDAAPASLQCVVVAGEACPPDLVRRHHATMGQAELHNEYGPSEASVWASATRLMPNDLVSIGRPVPGARLYVLDAHGRRAPIGTAGEIAIGGLGVARGYLDEDTSTAGRFTDDPFTAGGRLYRTGDRARYLRDGRLEFLGRIDHQIKVRGHRVEPGEIERALETHPDVREAAVAPAPSRLADDPEGLADALLELGEADALAQLESL